MPRGDAVQTVPTVEEEMAKFSGFSTNDGKTITKEAPEDLNPVAGKNTSAKEDEVAGARVVADKGAAAAKPANVALTDEESEAALEAAEKAAGKPLSESDKAKAIKDASNAKAGATRPNGEKKSVARYQRMQSERDRAVIRAAALETRIAALERGDTKPLTGDAKPDTKVAAGGPDPKDFPFGELDAGYIRALSRFETLATIAQAKEEEKTVRLTAAQQKAADDFDAAKAEFADKGAEQFEDFDEVVMGNLYDKTSNPGGWSLSDALGAMLLESDQGQAIAYELASDVKLSREIAAKTVARQAAWFGKREAELAGSGAKTVEEIAAAKAEADANAAKNPAAKVSKAPAPIDRARGQGSASDTSGNTQDFSAFEASWQASSAQK